MAIAPKTSRTTLKSFFKKNAIPTEADFAQLIDSAINQADDGVAKPDGQPLSLQPDAKDSGDKALLNFYRSFADPMPAWTLSLSPASKRGWSLGESGRRDSRLFIEESTGRVGLGTVTPVSLLDLRKDAPGELGPALSLSNSADSLGSGAAIDFCRPDPGGNVSVLARIQSESEENAKATHLAVSVMRKSDGRLTEALRITSNADVKVASNLGVGANVGIGSRAEAPRSALDTGTGVMSGAANDYQKAQFTLSGGGLVSWDGVGGFLRWSKRFIAISVERGSTLSGGHVNIECPTSNDFLTSWDNFDRVDANGVLGGVKLLDWEALYAVHGVGGDPNQVSFQVVFWNAGAFHAPSNWLLVAVVNSDNGSIKLGTGAVVAAGSNYAAQHGSSLPKGAVIMWSGEDVPAGWGLCDGTNGSPDLRGRFVLGAGQGDGLTSRNLKGKGGGESQILVARESSSFVGLVSGPRFDVALSQRVSMMPPFFVLAYIIKL